MSPDSLRKTDFSPLPRPGASMLSWLLSPGQFYENQPECLSRITFMSTSPLSCVMKLPWLLSWVAVQELICIFIAEIEEMRSLTQQRHLRPHVLRKSPSCWRCWRCRRRDSSVASWDQPQRHSRDPCGRQSWAAAPRQACGGSWNSWRPPATSVTSELSPRGAAHRSVLAVLRGKAVWGRQEHFSLLFTVPKI